jgi:glycosyltransferase involved in cell wall biosynthesis
MRGTLKVLLAADSRSFHTERLVGEMRRQGLAVRPVSMEHGQLHHYHLPRRGPIRQLHYRLAVGRMRHLIERWRPDVINAHYATGYGWLSALANRRHGIPMFLHLWGSDILIVPQKSPGHRCKARTALAAADYVLADSNYLLNEATRICTPASSSVIPWGIEKRFLKLHRSDYRLSKPLRIIVPRPHETVYNNRFILDSLREFIANGAVRLTIPSWGARQEQFKQAAAGLPESGITLYERIDRASFLRMMADHDVYLSAARFDSSPVSLIEAMALGLIPVAADIPGVQEWLNPQAGFLYPPDSTESLRSIINTLLSSGDDFEDMRQANLAKVKAEALFEDNVGRTIAIMKEVALK